MLIQLSLRVQLVRRDRLDIKLLICVILQRYLKDITFIEINDIMERGVVISVFVVNVQVGVIFIFVVVIN